MLDELNRNLILLRDLSHINIDVFQNGAENPNHNFCSNGNNAI